jgi:hypothetical protein
MNSIVCDALTRRVLNLPSSPSRWKRMIALGYSDIAVKHSDRVTNQQHSTESTSNSTAPSIFPSEVTTIANNILPATQEVAIYYLHRECPSYHRLAQVYLDVVPESVNQSINQSSQSNCTVATTRKVVDRLCVANGFQVGRTLNISA